MTTDEDKAAVLAVLEADTAAYLRRDPDAIAELWVHSPQARRMFSYAHLGVKVYEGWDAIDNHHRSVIKQLPESYAATRVHRERMNVVVNGDTAWVTHDQIGDRTGDSCELAGTQHELKIFQRMEGQWKIICIVVLQRAMDHETCPLIEVGPDKRVLWMNAHAHEQINSHPVLIISGGRLRARNRSHDAGLQGAVDWANRQMQTHMSPSPPSRPARAVILGEDDNAAPLFCWVLVEDGKILVSFNDEQLLKRRVAIAQGIYGLTLAQTQVAQLLAQGHDPSIAAEKLGITINTVRTHVQRMFDKTGAHSQSALVGLLLSAESPTAR
ncbi:MAG: LuxR C-terminal-related transcriptional regulator [Rhizobiaceae bacterium]